MRYLHYAKGVLLLILVAIFFSYGQALAAPAPQINTITPSNGPMSGGTLVTINGSNYSAGAAVYFGVNPAPEVYFQSTTRLEVRTPASMVSGRVDVRVVNPDGQFGIKLEGFLYAPVVTEAITAEGRTGSTTGGQPVTVKGSGFQNNLSLYIGTNQAFGVSVSPDGTTITAVTPPGQPGKVQVRVVNPDGGTGILPATDDKTFEYRLSQPRIDSLSPTRGTWQGGTEVTITGQELSPSGTVRFGGIPATVKQSFGTTQLVVVTPRASVGLQNVTITNPDGQVSPVTGNSKFEFYITPVIDSITPNYGVPVGGTVVTITGSNFPPEGLVGVTFGGVEATIQEVNIDNLKVVTPPGAPGPVDVKVYHKEEPEREYTVSQGFTYVSAMSTPVIDTVMPNSGSKDGGTTVTITGSDFRSGTETPLKVKFGSVYATQVTVHSTTELTVVTPGSPVTGPVDVIVENPDGGRATLADGFTFLAPERVLLITSITPNQGTMEGNTPVTVSGANFIDPAAPEVLEIELTIGGNPVRDLAWDSGTKSYRAFTPPGYGTQDVILTIRRQMDALIITERAVLANGYTYRVPASNPRITSVEPAGGPLSGGTLITIEGSDFRAPQPGETVQVYIGSLQATNVQVLDSQRITAVTPASPSTGIKDVTVINPDLATAVLPNAFTYFASTMTVVSVTPNRGPVDSPTRITITGANFNQDTDEFGSVNIVVELGTQSEGYLPATGVVVSPEGNTITAYAPVHTAGVKDLVVRNRFGSATLTGAFTYYVPSSMPEIVEVYPDWGLSTGGTLVTIYGNRFQSGASVTIGGRPATQVEVMDTDRIRALTPPGQPGTADVVVANPDGGLAILTGGFVYVSSPVISSVNPNRGSIHGGAILTLQGSDFYPGMEIYFKSVVGEVYTEVQVPSTDINIINSNTVKVRLPAWPGSVDPQHGLKVDIVVVNMDAYLGHGGGSYVAEKIFTYRQPLTVPNVEFVTPSFGPAQGGNEVLLTGSGFQPDVRVFFGWEEAQVLEVTPERVRVRAPANEPGVYDVTVVNVYDTGTFVKSQAYEYRQPLTQPRITAVSPPYGPAGGGTLMTITGEYLWPGVRVFIGNNEAFLHVDDQGQIVSPGESTQVISPRVDSGGKVIYLHTPEGPKTGGAYVAGPVDVNVVNPDGGSALLRNGFTYKLPDSSPVIDTINPAVGSVRGGTPVTITGSDFRPELQVYFGSAKATVVYVTPTAVEVITPAHPAGLVHVTLVNKDGGVTTAYLGFEYRVPGSEPVIHSVEPDTGSVMGGTEVTIRGNDFREGIKVFFGGAEAEDVVRVDYGTVTAVTPPGTAGKADVTVLNPDVGSYTLKGGFTYLKSVLQVEAVIPDRGPREGGIKVIIRCKGESFIETVRIYFGTEEAADPVILENGRMVEVTLPPSPQGRLGPVDVRIVNGDGAEALIKGGFTYLVPDSAPEVTGVVPAVGSTLGGNWVTVSGEDFRQGIQVFVGGYRAQEVILVDGRTLRVKMPPHSEGPKDVMVVNYDGGTGILPGGYTYRVPESQPLITGVEPSRGPQTGGTAITVTGLDFRQGVSLYIGGVPAENVVRVDYRTITAVTPPGPVGAVEVTVVNPDYGTDTLLKGFTYIKVEVPVVSSVTPDSGPATGGTAISISGSKFGKGVRVLVGGTEARDVERVSEDLVKAVTPPGEVGWQEVRVINTDGGWASLLEGFRYLKPRGAPDTPSWFTVVITDKDKLIFRWGASEFVDYYEIWVSRDPGGVYSFLARTEDTVFYSEPLPSGAGSFFRVRAVNELGHSSFTGEEFAEAEREEIASPEKESVETRVAYGTVETTFTYQDILRRDYFLDLSLPEYGRAREFVVRVGAEVARRAAGTLSIKAGDLSVSLPAATLNETYKNSLAGAGEDAWVEIILSDLGQQEAEGILKELPRGTKVVSRVWSVKLQARKGRIITPQLYFPSGAVLSFASPAAARPVMYYFTSYSNTWQPVNTLYTYQIAKLHLPGKYVMVDTGGR